MSEQSERIKRTLGELRLHGCVVESAPPPDIKPTNPKDVIGSNKLPLTLVPETMVLYAATAFLEGALKYGQYNWRIAGVRSSIYTDALLRHVFKYVNGEDYDPITGVHHLANALACIAIILDAQTCGKLTDDRPPAAPIGDLTEKLSKKVLELKELFKDCHPHQYTIADAPNRPRETSTNDRPGSLVNHRPGSSAAGQHPAHDVRDAAAGSEPAGL